MIVNMKKAKLSVVAIIVVMGTFLLLGCLPRTPVPPTSPVSQAPASLQAEHPAPAPAEYMLKVHFIDVGQGDAILVQTPAGQSMLADAGENSYGSRVVNYLTAQGVTELDVVVGTHPHSDHIGGLDTVINSLPVKKVFMPKVTHNTQSFRDVLKAIENRGLKITEARAGVNVALEGLDCQFIAPLQNSYQDLNNYSAVIKLSFGSQTFLLTGDAGTESEDQILASPADLKSTVLKVGHHGSYGSSGVKFLKAIRPQYAVIMTAQDNDYGHPHTQTLNRLKAIESNILRTDHSGTIVFTTDGSNLQVSTLNQGGK